MKSKILRRLIIISSILLTIVGILWFLAMGVETAINPDPDFNTVHSSQFNVNRFLGLKPGISADQIEHIIGEPFDIYTPKPVHRILYSNNDVTIDYSTGVSINDTTKEISFMVVSFELDSVIDIFNRNYYDKEKEDSLIHQSYTEIISKFGNPKQEVICNCNGSIWDYSKLKEGGYRGKHPIVNIRRLLLTPDNKLEKIIFGEGSPYIEYMGICN